MYVRKINQKLKQNLREAGDDIKFFFKQCLKMFIQNVILPLAYFFAKIKPVNKGLMIFADAHHDKCPESMRELLKRIIKENEFEVIEFYHDFGSCSGFKSLKYSINFMKLYAKSEFVIICDNFLPVSSCRKRKGTSVIQLWHGCGAFKKFGYDTSGDIPEYYKGNVYRNYDAVTVSSEECIKPFSTAMKLDESVFRPIGISRTDKYFDKDFISDSERLFYEENPNAKGKKVVLWAPTFRGNASHPYLVGDEAVVNLAEKLVDSSEWYLVTKSHPHMKKPVIAETESDLPTERIFPVTDILITDYSSVIYEYALFKKPILIFAPDLDEYSAQRGFYLDIEDMPAEIVRDSESLNLQAVKAAEESFNKKAAEEFLNKYMTACDGNATDRVMDLIKELRDKNNNTL